MYTVHVHVNRARTEYADTCRHTAIRFSLLQLSPKREKHYADLSLKSWYRFDLANDVRVIERRLQSAHAPRPLQQLVLLPQHRLNHRVHAQQLHVQTTQPSPPRPATARTNHATIASTPSNYTYKPRNNRVHAQQLQYIRAIIQKRTCIPLATTLAHLQTV